VLYGKPTNQRPPHVDGAEMYAAQLNANSVHEVDETQPEAQIFREDPPARLHSMHIPIVIRDPHGELNVERRLLTLLDSGRD
jgi:hypothetical protein